MPSSPHHLLRLQQTAPRDCFRDPNVPPLTATQTPSPLCPRCPSAAPPAPSSPPKLGRGCVPGGAHLGSRASSQGGAGFSGGCQQVTSLPAPSQHTPIEEDAASMAARPRLGAGCTQALSTGHTSGGTVTAPGAVTGLSPPRGCLAGGECACVCVCVCIRPTCYWL